MMAEIAVMGHGVVGSGVMEVLISHKDSIAKRAKEEVHVKHILDLREFPGLPYSGIFTKDFNRIVNDPQVKIVVEVMGGLEPAYTFSLRPAWAGASPSSGPSASAWPPTR